VLTSLYILSIILSDVFLCEILRTFGFDGLQWLVVLIENPDRATILQPRATGEA
jgi:hypothetical protein